MVMIKSRLTFRRLLLVFVFKCFTGNAPPLACSQDRLLPQSISLRLPLFTDELDAVQQYFLMLVGAYKKLGKFPAISKQTKECKQKSEQEQRGNMKSMVAPRANADNGLLWVPRSWVSSVVRELTLKHAKDLGRRLK